MWTLRQSSFGRQLLADAQGKNRMSTCRAKRYIPHNKQHKKTSGGAGSSRRKPDAEPDADELLRELNSGGAGWLRDEEEQDWGLDDVAEHAKARKQRQLTVFPDRAPETSSSSLTATAATASNVAVRSGSGIAAAARRRGGPHSVDPQVSPLEAGHARFDGGGGGEVAGGPASSGDHVIGMMGTEEGRQLGGNGMATGGRSSTAVELESSYARRNPEVIEALRLHGIAVRVRQEAFNDDDEEAGDGGAGASTSNSRRESDGYMYGDEEDDDLGLNMHPDLSLYEQDDEISAKGGRSRRGTIGDGPAGKSDWYDSLAAAGFSMRTNATGEVFLERTVRQQKRKTTTPGSSSTSSSTTAATTPSPTSSISTSFPTAAAAPSSPTPTSHTPTTRTIPASTTPPAPAAGGSVQSAGSSPSPPPPPLVPLLDPMTGLSAIAMALSSLTAPQHVLDFLELSYPQWAANGYRLADMRIGRLVPAPGPAEAAHCLHALALTARRSAIGGWRCLDLAAGRQAQGLAEALRATPPRLLPEHSTPQLAGAYFEVARRYWLEPRTDPIIGDPQGAEDTWERNRGGRSGLAAPVAVGAAVKTGTSAAVTAAGAPADDRNSAHSTMAVGSTASSSDVRPDATTHTTMSSDMGGAFTGGEGKEGQTEEVEEKLLGDMSGSGLYSNVPYGDPIYGSLLAKYTAISERQQLLDRLRNGAAQQQPHQHGHDADRGVVLNGRATAAAAAALQQDAISSRVAANRNGTAAVEDRLRNTVHASPSSSAGAVAREATAVEVATAAERRAAKIDCLVAALWAMSSLGGPPYFQAETEAVLSILVRCLASSSPPPASSSSSSPSPSTSSSGTLSGWQSGQVLWALGNARHVTPRLADLEACMLRSGGLAAMCPRDVSRVLWGFASLGRTPERLLLSIRPDWGWRAPRIGAGSGGSSGGGGGAGGRGGGRGKVPSAQGDVRSFNPQQLAVVVWALAVMQQVDTLPFRCAWATLLSRASEIPRSEAVLTQIWQTNLAIALESASTTSFPTPAPAPPRGTTTTTITAPNDLTAAGLSVAASASASSSATSASSSASGGGVPPFDESAAHSLLLRARSVFLSATSGLRRRVQSGYQRQMANSLTGLKMMHLIEDNREGYSIDITLPALRIAIEADGPTHISRTPGGAMLGATAMKRRHLQRLGWQVINITYKEWDNLASESSKRAFLQERINQALLAGMRSEGLQDDEGEV